MDRAPEFLGGSAVAGEGEIGCIFLADKGGEATKEDVLWDADRVSFTNRVRETTNDKRGTVSVSGKLGTGKKPDGVTPEARPLGADTGVEEDLVTAGIGDGGREGLLHQGRKVRGLGAAQRVALGRTGTAAGNQGLARHGGKQVVDEGIDRYNAGWGSGDCEDNKAGGHVGIGREPSVEGIIGAKVGRLLVEEKRCWAGNCRANGQGSLSAKEVKQLGVDRM